MKLIFRIFPIIAMIGIVFCCVAAVTDYERQELISNDFFSENGIEFTTLEMDTEKNLEDIYTHINNFELRTPRNADDDSENCYFAVLAKDFKPEFRIKNGRYFNSTDFFTESRVAVVGADAAETSVFKKSDGKSYVNIFEKDYLVIGTIKQYENADINTSVFYNIDSLPVYSGNLVIDSDNHQDILLAEQKLSAAGLINGYSERATMDRLTNLSGRLKKIMLFSSAAALVLSLLRAFIAFLNERDAASVRHLFGMPTIVIVRTAVLRSTVELTLCFAALLVVSAVTEHLGSIPLTLLYLCPGIIFSLAGEALLVFEYLSKKQKIS